MPDSPPLPRFGPLICADDPHGDRWVVHEPFQAEFVAGRIETIHPGFRTDLLSSPPPIRCWLRRHADTEKAAVYHDYRYAMQDLPRTVADERFRRSLRAVGVGRIKARAMWFGVRGWGWHPWRQHRRQGRDR